VAAAGGALNAAELLRSIDGVGHHHKVEGISEPPAFKASAIFSNWRRLGVASGFEVFKNLVASA
jgi:hypothetical protein